MQKLTSEGSRIANELAQRHGFSVDAVTHMMFAVRNGNGSMAQFNHSEFAGGGQWMRGGMLMLSDMFNNYLKTRVDSLCNEISDLLSNQPGLLRAGSFQSQTQSGNANHQSQASGDFATTNYVPSEVANEQNQNSLFEPDANAQWWPKDLGQPNAVGSQNNVAYAYFAARQRLAVKTGDQVWTYDTLNHQIGGFSQQQGLGGSIIFTSQFGTVNLSTLPVVSRNGETATVNTNPPAVEPSISVTSGMNEEVPSVAVTTSENAELPTSTPAILNAIERLGELFEKGILTDEEFTIKKQELLERL